MKKYFLCLASFLVFALTINSAIAAKTTTNPTLASAIKLYKAKNYTQAYIALNKFVEKDPSNALAYYYLAMSSAQVGKKTEAISNYNKALSLATPNGQLEKYAAKGKRCLETPDACNEDQNMTQEDRFIQGRFGSGFSDSARGTYEKHKIENIMRQMNREDSMAPSQFKEYKDFSSEVPTNDEIVSALRTLQKAGFNNVIPQSGYNSELSLLTGNNNNNYEMLNMLLGNNNSNLSPQVIQSLLTNQLSTGF